MKVRELLNSPDKWARKYLARDKDGRETNVFSQDATCFCLIGATYKCYQGQNSHEILKKLRITIASFLNVENQNDISIGKFNDSELTSFEDIKHILEKADI